MGIKSSCWRDVWTESYKLKDQEKEIAMVCKE